jgi:hypothetical protein
MVESNPFRILAIAGSLQQGSYNRGLLRAAEELAPAWVEVQFFDIGTVPFFNEDIEADGDPEQVQRFKEAISRANAVLIATPEYNGVVPGVLANGPQCPAQQAGGCHQIRFGERTGGSARGTQSSRGDRGPRPAGASAARLEALRRAGQLARRGDPRGDPPVGRGSGSLVPSGPARRAWPGRVVAPTYQSNIIGSLPGFGLSSNQ